MKKFQKLLCILLGVLFALGVTALPAVAADQSGKLCDTVSWTLKGDTLTVTGSGEVPDGAFDAVLQKCGDKIKRLVVEDGVVSLGRRAFWGYASLESVRLPASTVKIDDWFWGCSGLKEAKLASGVQVVGDSAFMDCVSLTRIELPASVHMIGSAAFKNCENLTEIRLPAALSGIGREAFMNTGLTAVTLPGSVRMVDGWAFAQCKSLKSAVLSGGQTMLSDCLFQNSTLESLVLPKSIRSVSENTFYYCTLKDLYYEGAEAEFRSIFIHRSGDNYTVPGNTDEIFKTAALHFNAAKARGDLDNNGKADPGDARTVLRAAIGLENIPCGTYDFYRADADFDAAVTTADARLVLRDAVDLDDLSKSAPKTKTYTDAQLSALASFTGTFTQLLQQYDVSRIYGGGLTITVFPGAKDTAVLMFGSGGEIFFNKRCTPKASLAKLMTVPKDSAPEAVLALDPGAATGVYAPLGRYMPYTILCCTTDGHTVFFDYSNDKLYAGTVY